MPNGAGCMPIDPAAQAQRAQEMKRLLDDIAEVLTVALCILLAAGALLLAFSPIWIPAVTLLIIVKMVLGAL
jgi:hypothetical protein